MSAEMLQAHGKGLSMLKVFLSLSRRAKQIVAVVADFVLLSLAFWSAIALRFETLAPDLAPYAWQMVAAPFLALPIFVKLGLVVR